MQILKIEGKYGEFNIDRILNETANRIFFPPFLMGNNYSKFSSGKGHPYDLKAPQDTSLKLMRYRQFEYRILDASLIEL